MKKIFLLVPFAFYILDLQAQSVGINSTGAAPHASALLHVDAGTSSTKGLLVTGEFLPSAPLPNLGTGSRLMFYPGKAAFRAGYAVGTRWDNANVGSYSAAFGNSNTASGQTSLATGEGSIASGVASLAMGVTATASATGSIAIGTVVSASGFRSMAFGTNTTASSDYSTAMGYLMNANRRGVFAIGDTDPNNEGAMASSLDDAFIARFWNGFYLLTSGNTVRTGVQIAHGGNAWTTICDVDRKENFEPLNGEDVLQKISKINFTSWNYKQQDPQTYRHYGIMAQDFYNAFGKDKYGTIGNDTTVNPVDMIGIDMAAIQALEKRTVALNAENKKLASRNKKLEGEVAELKTSLQKEREAIAKRLQQLEALVLQQNKQNKFVVKQ